MTPRKIFLTSAIFLLILNAVLVGVWIHFAWFFVLTGGYLLIGLYDMYQHGHNILKNYPFFGHFRYLLESIRPEMQQYFVATNLSERPFNREQRALVYQRSKKVNDTLPFGTQHDIIEEGYEFTMHSMAPTKAIEGSDRVLIGNEQCQKPYSSSRINISAMSYGALGHTSIEALNLGAKKGGFSHNTGEGGLTPYHLKHQGDIVLQIGTGYFGCRTPEGNFSEENFKKQALIDNVKMIEIKISQGAKPSHGGLLPAAKINQEIADIRGIKVGEDCDSPPTHSAFDTPKGLLDFIAKLRQLSGGKPVGFKIAIGKKTDFMGICKAMLEKKIYPDFITIDGAEGGTGAAPIEFSNRLGLAINEALIFVHSTLIGAGLRDKITLIAAGKVVSAFDMILKIAIGADACNIARGMLFSIGCIQARRCNTNECPTGIATQDPKRIYAVNPEHKSDHVVNFHHATMDSFLGLMGAIGIDSPDKLTPNLILKRITETEVKSFDEIYPFLEEGDLLKENIHKAYAKDWANASAEHF